MTEGPKLHMYTIVALGRQTQPYTSDTSYVSAS